MGVTGGFAGQQSGEVSVSLWNGQDESNAFLSVLQEKNWVALGLIH